MKSRKSNHISSDREPSRRSFLTKLWMILGALTIAECVGLVFAFLRPRKSIIREGGFGATIVAGQVDNFPLDSVTAFSRGRFYLARLEDGGFLALSRKCTHLGCTVPWIADEKRFACPCHKSAFNIRGEVISPPAPRALDIFPVSIENRRVKVDTSKRIRRSEFRASQVTYPETR